MSAGEFDRRVFLEAARGAAAACALPLGPFINALGGPLIDGNGPNHSGFDIAPTVLVDDGQSSIYWGSFSPPRAAKLKSIQWAALIASAITASTA